MTNNPTIDGVSRAIPEELLIRLALPPKDGRGWTNWNTAEAYQAAKELRALLDASAVERQPIKNASEVAYNLQAENAALQSTIARLEARIVELENGGKHV